MSNVERVQLTPEERLRLAEDRAVGYPAQAQALALISIARSLEAIMGGHCGHGYAVNFCVFCKRELEAGTSRP